MPKKRNPFVAVLLTFLTPGMGQVYSGRAKRGLILWAAFHIVLFFHFRFLLPRHATGLAVTLSVLLLGFLAILADAWIGAKKADAIILRPYNRWYVYLLPSLLWMASSTAFKIAAHRPLTSCLFGIESFSIPSRSMQPTLQLGDLFFVDMTAYHDRSVQRGDIVVFPFPADPSKSFVKRVVAVGGDVVEIMDGELLINQRPVFEPYVQEKDHFTIEPLTVPAGMTFVLGDNRPNSADSREWGFVSENTIQGKAVYVYWSKDRGRIGRLIK